MAEMDAVQKTIGGFRAAIQDLLVPELKAVQVELKHHSEQFGKIEKRFDAVDRWLDMIHKEMDRRFEAMQTEMNRRFEVVDQRFEAMQAEMSKRFEMVDQRFEAMQVEMNRRFELLQKGLHGVEKVQERILEKLDVKEEMAEHRVKWVEIEHRFERLEQKVEQLSREPLRA